MPKALVLVETPAKAATYSALVGPDYLVVATEGPLRDLPSNQLGFEVKGDFAFSFEIPDSKKAVLQSIVEKAQDASTVFLAMDLSPDGELAAWNAYEVLLPLLPEGTTIRRARATELTLRGLRQAFRYAGVVDTDAVEAQKARRAMDRLVIQNITPHLWKNVQPNLSLGRLQAIALRMLCSREHERETTLPITRWRYALRTRCASKPDQEILFRLIDVNGQPLYITEKDRAPVVKTALSTAKVTMDTVRRESITEPPPPAFTTETLLAEAAAVLGLSPGQTQVLAQSLYEGVTLGSERKGLITFPITAESRIAETAQTTAQELIRKHFGFSFLAPQPEETVTLGRPEAIRPTDPTVIPESLQGKLPVAELRLYTIIWRRFIASQMAPARIDRSTAVADAMAADGINGYQLHAIAENVEFRGHRALTDTIKAPSQDIFKPDPILPSLPTLSPGESLKNLECIEECSGPVYTARYTEAEFVRTLAANGVGYPSTFAPIIASLYQRNFAKRENRTIEPTALGRRVLVWMFSVFPRLLSVTSASIAEKAIASIAAGRGSAAEHIGHFYNRFHRIWTGESKDERADAADVELVFSALQSVVNWGSVDVNLDLQVNPANDEARVDELRTEAESDSGLSVDEYEEILAIFCRYRPQIPGYIETVKKLRRYDLLEIPDNAPDAHVIQMKMEWVAKAPLSPESKRFVDSLQNQAERGRRLTEAQVRVLDDILAAQARHIEGLTPEILQEMGVTPRTQKDLDSIQRLLDALGTITEWRPPSQRGKRLYDDASFANSVREQFAKRGDLSPNQFGAVKRMISRYHDRIPNYAELAALYNLPPEGLPQPNLFGRRSKKAKEASAPEAPAATATPAPSADTATPPAASDSSALPDEDDEFSYDDI